MVEFGKKLRAQQVPEWKDHYISYKMMKKKLKEYARLQQPRTKENHKRILREFSEMLDRQIEKVVLFLLQRQGELAAQLARLGDVYEPNGGMLSTDEAHEVCCNIGRELLKLLHFLEVNAVGLRKILKKFDKHIGYKLTDYYVTSRSNHPYSQLQQVFRHVGIGAMVGALSRKFTQLQHHRNSLVSIYDAPTNVVKEPVLEAIGAAQERLSHSTNFLEFLAQHALIIGDEFPRSPELPLIEKEYHFMSLFLNLANTFLYMVNTYIVVPTADNYAMSLGAAPTFCGVIIGSMAVAQLVSSVYFSAWSNRSYFRPLLFSSVMLLLGNVLYGIAYDLRSLTVLIVGRLLCGLGSARAINRRYISDCVPLQSRLKASAAFVSASALGMACGPALAVAFETEKVIFGMTFNSNTLPGWTMAAGWLLYLLLLWLSFKEPLGMHDENGSQALETAGVNVHDSERAVERVVKIDGNLLEPLHPSDSFEHEETKGEGEAEGEDDADSEDSRKPANSIKDAYKLLTFPVKVQLLIYFMLKYVMEILISESSVVTEYYFQWTTREIALFLAVLGLTVLPVNAVVGGWLSNIFEDRQILLVSEVFTCLGVLISFAGPVPYTIGQYVGGALLMFVSAEVLEGVNLSLLSKVMSSRLACGTFNGGLLSTEAGTLARVIADTTITLAGYLGISKLLNATLLPSLVIGIVSLVLTFVSYNSMF